MTNTGYFIVHYPNGDETRLAVRRVSDETEENRFHLASARRCEEKDEAVAEMERIALTCHAVTERTAA